MIINKWEGEGMPKNLFDFEPDEILFTREIDIEIDDKISIFEYANTLLKSFPELDSTKLRKVKNDIIYSDNLPKVKINNQVLVLSFLEFKHVLTNKYIIRVKYDTPIRIFYVIFVLLGFMFGVAPGVVIWIGFAEQEDAKLLKINPIFYRFELIVKASKGLVGNKSETDSNNNNMKFGDNFKKLSELKNMFTSGIISEEEFNEKKKEILSRI